MAATITLKRKCFNFVQQGIGALQSHSNTPVMGLQLKPNTADTSTSVLKGLEKEVAVETPIPFKPTATGTEVNKLAADKKIFNNGAKSTGAIQGLKNTWGRAGTMGKAGMIGAGVVGTGLALKGAASLFGGSKKD